MNELDPIFSVSVNLVACDDDVLRWSAEILHPDLNTVIIVIANNVIRDNNVDTIIEINAIIAVKLKCAELHQAAATILVVHTIAGAPDQAVKQVEPGIGQDTVYTSGFEGQKL